MTRERTCAIVTCTGRCRRSGNHTQSSCPTGDAPVRLLGPTTTQTSPPVRPGLLRWLAGAAGGLLVIVLLLVRMTYRARRRTNALRHRQRVVGRTGFANVHRCGLETVFFLYTRIETKALKLMVPSWSSNAGLAVNTASSLRILIYCVGGYFQYK